MRNGTHPVVMFGTPDGRLCPETVFVVVFRERLNLSTIMTVSSLISFDALYVITLLLLQCC